MKHRPLFFLAFSLALVAIMLGAMRLGGGSTDVAFAHIDTGATHLELDLNTTNGSGPCNPVDTAAAHAEGGGNYTVAVCLSDVMTGLAPQALQFALLYNDTLNQCNDVVTCVPGACDTTGLNDNPNLLEANLDVNAGWDCNLSNDSDGEPKCDTDPASGAGHGKAFIGCMANNQPQVTVGNGISTAIATVTFHVIAGGTDNMSLNEVDMTDGNLIGVVSCFDSGPCIGGTDNKTGPLPATPTNTPPPPTATATPNCGGPGQPACPTSTPTPRGWTRTPTPEATSTPGGEGPGPEPTTAPPPPPPPSGGGGPSVTPPSTGTGSGGTDWTAMLALTFAGASAITFALASRLYLRSVKNK